MIPNTILLDLDDTLVPFTELVVHHFTGDASLMLGVVDYNGSLFDVCGCTEADFYRLMCDAGFWESLPLSKLGADLLGAASELPQHVMVITALPFVRAGVLPRALVEQARTAATIGKLAWLQRHGIEDYAIVTEKWPLASSSLILVDDNPHRTRAFAEQGGQALTVPSPWNDASGDVVELLKFMCEPIAGVD